MTPTIPIWSVPSDLWRGQTVVIAGNGPSLARAQIEHVRRKRRGGSGARLIVINRASSLAWWADLLFAADSHRSWQSWPAMIEFPGIKVALLGPTSDVKATAALARDGVKILRWGGSHDGVSDDRQCLNGNNGIHQSINLSVHLGARKIVLIGADMHDVPPGGQTHWHGEGQRAPPNFAVHVIPRFASLIKPLTARGIEIVNATPDSALQCFPMAPLEEAL
jgi:hypothetical protein